MTWIRIHRVLIIANLISWDIFFKTGQSIEVTNEIILFQHQRRKLCEISVKQRAGRLPQSAETSEGLCTVDELMFPFPQLQSPALLSSCLSSGSLKAWMSSSERLPCFFNQKVQRCEVFFLKTMFMCSVVTVLMLNKKNFFSRNETNIISSHHSVITQDSMFMTRGKQLNKEKQKI